MPRSLVPAVLVALGFVVMVGAICWVALAPQTAKKPRDRAVMQPDEKLPPLLPAGPKRVPVAGAAGFTVVFNADGTSYLETPKGKVELVDAGFAARPSDKQIADRIAERLAKKPEGVAGQGQFIVLDDGVVDIPKNALITLVERDRLVVLNDDGTSTVYRADGVTEVRRRKQPLAVPSPKGPK